MFSRNFVWLFKSFYGCPPSFYIALSRGLVTTDSLALPSHIKSSLPNSQNSRSGERLGKRAVCSLYWPFEKHPTPTSRYHPCSLLFASIFRILVRPVTSRSMPQRFCVPHIWQLISNELFSAHKKSSYRTKSGCFIHTAWMIVGLMLWPPSPFSLSPSVLPKCYPPLPQLFLKQRQQASGTKELLTKCKVIPHRTDAPHGVRLDMMAPHDGLSGSRTEFYQPLLASHCSLSDEFHWPGGCLWRPECLDPSPAPDMITFTPALSYVRSENS